MSEQLASVIGKVQKLLALANSSSAHEAANAAAAANKLIDAYRLSELDLAVDQQESDPIMEDDEYIYETGRIVPWKVRMIHVLADHYGVANFNDNHFATGRKVSRFKLVGRTSDIKIVRYMFAWLTAECQRLAGSIKGRGHVAIASYCEGFVAGVAMQLKTSREEIQRTVTSSAIIKLNERLEESSKFMYDHNSNLKTVKTKSHSQRDIGSFLAGQRRGQDIHLGAAMSGSKTKLLS